MKVLYIIGLLVFVGCMKEQNRDKISAAQVQAVAKMESDFQMARVYNDSLINAIKGTQAMADSARIHYFDNQYHQYDADFDKCHGQFEHNLSSADHSHNSQGMFEMHNSHGGMMGSCSCCSNGGHKVEIHRQMAALRQLHSQYYR